MVANHFNTYEYVFYGNGGSNEGAVDYWKRCFIGNPVETFDQGRVPIQNLNHNEVSWVVFQLTQWQRDTFTFSYKNQKNINGEFQKFTISFNKTWTTPWNNMWAEHCVFNNIDVDKWMNDFIEHKVLMNVKNFLEDLESKGIKTAIFTWPDEFVNYIRKDSWLNDRFITFDYKNQNFSSIEKLMGEGAMHSKPPLSPELTIKWDEENFEVTPKDHHPSLQCHKVMADNVINFIEKRKAI
jgi:hypothetical protein